MTNQKLTPATESSVERGEKSVNLESNIASFPKFERQDLLDSLKDLPEHWSLTPISGEKRAYRKGWQEEEKLDRAFLEKEIRENKYSKGIGLRTGEYSGGILVIDQDGASAEPLLKEILAGEVPTSVSWRSGRPGRYQIAFQVPDEWRERFKDFGSKRLETKKAVKDAEGKKIEESEQLEIFYNWRYCVLPPSEHPQTGLYHWIISPTETEVEEAPIALLEYIFNEFINPENQKKTRSKKQQEANPLLTPPTQPASDASEKQDSKVSEKPVSPEPEPFPQAPDPITEPDQINLPVKGSIPLLNCLSQDKRKAVESGSGEGTRNEIGGKIALELADIVEELEHLGQSYEGDPEQILEDYFLACKYDQKEAQTWASQKWQSAKQRCKGLDDQALEWLHIRVRNHIWAEMKKQNTGKGFGLCLLVDYKVPEKESLEAFICDRLFGDDWIVIDDNFYNYQDLRGYWKLIPVQEVKCFIVKGLRKFYKLKKDKEEDEEGNINTVINKYHTFSTELNKNRIFSYALSDLKLRKIPKNKHLRAFSNGTADMRTGKLKPHEKKDYLLNASPLPYKPNQAIPPHLEYFIRTSFGEEYTDLIRAIMGMFLDPSAPYGKFVHLIGESGSGKGTMARLITNLVGESNSITLTDFEILSNQDKRHQNLSNVSLAIAPDIGGFMRNLRAFFELVDNGFMSGRPLHRNAYQKKWNCRFLSASVNQLQIENAGDGWKRRCIPLPTKALPKNHVPDHNLDLRLNQELAEITSWALSMDRAYRDRLLMTSDGWTAKMMENQAEQNTYSDSISAFIDSCMGASPIEEEGERDGMTSENLYELYKAFCKAGSFSPYALTKFRSRLKSLLHPLYQKAYKKRVDGKVRHFPALYKGLRPLKHCFRKDSLRGTLECNIELCWEGNLPLILNQQSQPAAPPPEPAPQPEPAPKPEPAETPPTPADTEPTPADTEPTPAETPPTPAETPPTPATTENVDVTEAEPPATTEIAETPPTFNLKDYFDTDSMEFRFACVNDSLMGDNLRKKEALKNNEKKIGKLVCIPSKYANQMLIIMCPKPAKEQRELFAR